MARPSVNYRRGKLEKHFPVYSLFVCMYVCTYVCINVCMCVCLYMCVYMYVLYACMYVCMCIETVQTTEIKGKSITDHQQDT